MTDVLDLGIITQLRGRDSTGICVGRRQKHYFDLEVLKQAENASSFLDCYDVRKAIFHGSDPQLIAGHCRAATVGDINDDNAHPFIVRNIIGMHNGTIPSLKDAEKDRPDSLAFFKILQADGLQKAVNKAKGGAYAFVWVDERDDSLNFLRNKERPLFLMEAQGTLYWSSEARMLDFIANRGGLKSPEISDLPLDTHLKVDMRSPMTSRKLKEMEPATLFSMRNYGEPVEKVEVKHEHVVLGPVMPAKPDLGIKSHAGKHKHKALKIMFKAFNNKFMTTHKAENLLKNGCAFCAHEPKIYDKSFWFNNDSFLCEGCQKDQLAMFTVQAKSLFEGQLITLGGENGKRQQHHTCH